MIKPFEIISLRQEEFGTGVIYRVSQRIATDTGERLITMETYFLAPPGADVEQALYEHLKEGGVLQ